MHVNIRLKLTIYLLFNLRYIYRRACVQLQYVGGGVASSNPSLVSFPNYQQNNIYIWINKKPPTGP